MSYLPGGGYTNKQATKSDIGIFAGIPHASEVGRYRRHNSELRDHSSRDIIRERGWVDTSRISLSYEEQLDLGGGYTPKEAATDYSSATGIERASKIGRDRRDQVEREIIFLASHLSNSALLPPEEPLHSWEESLRNPDAKEFEQPSHYGLNSVDLGEQGHNIGPANAFSPSAYSPVLTHSPLPSGGYTPKEVSRPQNTESGIPEAAEIGRERRDEVNRSVRSSMDDSERTGRGYRLWLSQTEADREWEESLRNPHAKEFEQPTHTGINAVDRGGLAHNVGQARGFAAGRERAKGLEPVTQKPRAELEMRWSVERIRPGYGA